MMRRPSTRAVRAVHERGYTLVEILIALLIALFLLGGLGTMVAGTRRTSTNQTALAQLQDEQRLAMSMLNDVIQVAGYFNTNPTGTNTYWRASDAFPTAITAVGGPTLAAGQFIGGTHVAGAPDTIAIRYSTNGTDGMINCNGVTSTTAATWTNYFFIYTPTGSTPTNNPSQLQCSTDGQTADAITLVSNVVNMQIWYGVSTVGGSCVTSGVTCNADTYMTGDQVTNWANVVSARMTLTFDNPLYGQPGQAQYAFLTRLITLQSQAL